MDAQHVALALDEVDTIVDLTTLILCKHHEGMIDVRWTTTNIAGLNNYLGLINPLDKTVWHKYGDAELMEAPDGVWSYSQKNKNKNTTHRHGHLLDGTPQQL